jgi:twitching motility protein PilT
MLADSLRAVMCQYLVPRKDGTGRCLAAEILLNNDAVANLIRKGKAYQLPSIVTTSRELGMQSMDSDLKRLHQEGLVSAEDVYMRAVNKKEFEKLEEEPSTQAAAAAPGAATGAAGAPPTAAARVANASGRPPGQGAGR